MDIGQLRERYDIKMPSVFLGVVVCVMFRGAVTHTFLFSDFLDKRPTENKTVKIKDHFAIGQSPQQQQQHWLVIYISRLYLISPARTQEMKVLGGKNLSCQKMDMPVM